MTDKSGDLERKVTKNIDPIICDFNNCILRGSYYKCYFPSYQKCAIYLDWEVTKKRDENLHK